MIKCLLIDHEDQTRKAIEEIINEMPHLQLIKSCKSIAQAREALQENKVDIVFLDVEVPDLKNYEFLDGLEYEKPPVIALSNNKNVAVNAYDSDACDFILKPFTYERILRAITKALRTTKSRTRELEARNAAAVMFLKVDHRLVKISLKEITLVEALADYVNIYVGGKKYTIHSTMKGIESQLPAKYFLRVHKSYIVNINRISEIEKDTLTIDKRIIPIGNTYRVKLKDYLKII
jgi:DNA-binding LytR/AlgR family response regulator